MTMRVRVRVSLIAAVAALAVWPHRAAAGQELALTDRSPRFLYSSSAHAAPVEIDARRAAVFRRVVSLQVDAPTVGRLLAAIERQTGLVFTYGNDFPVDRPVAIRAESIAVSAALSAILYDTGVDVVLGQGGRADLRRRAPRAVGMQQGAVTGRIADGKTGTGIGGVDVSLEGTRWRTTTGDDGRYRLGDVADGRYTLLARRIGYGPERRAVTVTAGQETAIEVALQPATTKLGEVVVTAQKREERLQDVPVSIAVVTPEEIDRRGLVSAEDYLRGIPGVNQTNDFAGQSIVIRGLQTATVGLNFYTGSTVATYFGETPTTTAGGLAGSSNVDAKLVDIDRVEVLRGPQGTAFGSSSIGGAVRTIPVAPKLDRIEGKLDASYSRTAGTGGDNYHFEGVANIPLLKDKLALRTVGYRYEDSGFYRNVARSDPTFQATVVVPNGAQAFAVDEEEFGTSRFTGGRIAALFEPSDALKVRLSYLKQKTETDGFAATTPGAAGPYDQTLLQVAPEHVVRGQKGGVLDTDIDLANAVLAYDFGWVNLLGTYSYTVSRSTWVTSFTAFALPWAWSQTTPGPQRAHSGEIRLTTQFDGAWNFLGGLYAEDLDDAFDASGAWYGSPQSNIFAPGQQGFLGAYRERRNLKQTAAFAEVSWEFVPSFTLTGGVRAYDYERTSQVTTTGALYAGGSVGPERGFDASGTSFRGNLSHKLNNNALIYAGWSQGFRMGRPTVGLPPQCDFNNDGIVDGTSNLTMEETRRLESDRVNNYELGGKFTLLDHRLMIAADVYRADWSDLAVTVSAPGTFGSIDGSGCGWGYETNGGSARSEGIEFQANVYITEAFRVDAGGSWIRAKFAKDVPDPVRAGARLPGSPEVNANLGLQYEFHIGGSPAFVRVDPIYVGSFYSSAQKDPLTKSGGYVKVDASARMAIRNTNIDLFVRNVTNADDFTQRLLTLGWRLRPRTIGVQLSRDFSL